MNIRREMAGDVAGVRAVNVAAFGSALEADIVDLLRAGGRGLVLLVAEDEGEIVGHIAFSPVDVIGAPELRAMALAPLAVRPQSQRAGVGSALVRAGLEECRRAGAGAVFLIGHPSYYPRFGFAPASPRGFICEFDVPDEVFMAVELTPGALSGHRGTVHFDAAFRTG